MARSTGFPLQLGTGSDAFVLKWYRSKSASRRFALVKSPPITNGCINIVIASVWVRRCVAIRLRGPWCMRSEGAEACFFAVYFSCFCASFYWLSSTDHLIENNRDTRRSPGPEVLRLFTRYHLHRSSKNNLHFSDYKCSLLFLMEC